MQIKVDGHLSKKACLPQRHPLPKFAKIVDF